MASTVIEYILLSPFQPFTSSSVIQQIINFKSTVFQTVLMFITSTFITTFCIWYGKNL